MKKFVLSVFAILMLCVQLSAQSQRVTGKVTDGNEPLSFAVIFEKGNDANAVTTSVDGSYSISVPSSATLVFTYTGMSDKQVQVGNKTVINVTMESQAHEADAIVIIGYGSGQKSSTVSGQISQVGAGIVNDKPVANVTDALQGQVSGLSVITPGGEPSATSSISVRGQNSINASSTPLIVVDGVPTDQGQLLTLNANDFESVVVLKDASATSIYGSRAANGVMYITTKKGSRNSDAKIRLNGSISLSNATNKDTGVMGGYELLEFHKKYGEIYTATSSVYDKYKKRLDGMGEFDWFDYVFNTALVYNTDLSVQGGSETTTYYISGSFMDQAGIAPRSSLQRYTFRANLDTQAKKWLRFGANISLGYDERETVLSSTGGGGVNVLNPSFFTKIVPTYYHPYDELMEPTPEWGGILRDPRYIAEKNPYTTTNLQINGAAYMSITPIKGLTIKSQLGLDGYDATSYAKALPDQYSTTPTRTSKSFARKFTLSSTNTIEYKFKIGEKHDFSALLGHEGILSNGNSFSVVTSGQSYADMSSLTNGTNVKLGDVGYQYSTNALLSFFGRLAYSFNDKYSIDLTLRNDTSSKFGPANRSAFFYSVGGVWNAKKEKFLIDNRIISDLRVRATYGTSGNSGIGDFAHLNLASTTNYGGETGLVLVSLGDPKLGWESSKQFNFGFDLGFLQNKITLSTSYYHKTTEDMLMSVPISATTGFTSMMQNVASMVNQGIDIDLNFVLFQNKSWYVGFNTSFNYNHNEITKLFNGLNEYYIQNSSQIYKVGESLGSFYLPEFLGVDPETGNPLYYSSTDTNNITSDTNQADNVLFNKSFIAPYSGGFGLTAQWKTLSFSANFSYMADKWVINGDRFFLENTVSISGFGRSVNMRNIWEQPGDITDIPRYGANAVEYSSALLEDASFLRLKNITLSYSVPKKALEKTKFFEGIRVYFIARNLFTVTNYTGYDPEVAGSIVYGMYPQTREYSLGLELTF